MFTHQPAGVSSTSSPVTSVLHRQLQPLHPETLLLHLLPPVRQETRWPPHSPPPPSSSRDEPESESDHHVGFVCLLSTAAGSGRVVKKKKRTAVPERQRSLKTQGGINQSDRSQHQTDTRRFMRLNLYVTLFYLTGTMQDLCCFSGFKV